MWYIVMDLIDRIGRREKLFGGERGFYRYWFGSLFLAPVLLWVWVPVSGWINSTTGPSPWIAWAMVVPASALICAIAYIWIKTVSPWVSLALAAVAWTSVIFLSPYPWMGLG